MAVLIRMKQVMRGLVSSRYSPRPLMNLLGDDIYCWGASSGDYNTTAGMVTVKIEIGDSNPFLVFILRVVGGRIHWFARMPRRNRIVVPGLPHHITQRGNGRRVIFDSDGDRRVFLALLGRYAAAYGMSIWGYCLMSNHFHLIVVPERADSAAKALGSLLASYARYLNVQRESCGHLWQARYYSVPMEPVYCWKALAYVEHNPVRSAMSETAERYRWSSAAARLGMCAAPAWLDLGAWREEWTANEWRRLLEDRRAESVIGKELHEVTLSGYPLGRALVERLERELGTRLRRGQAGRPRKEKAAPLTLQ